MVTQGAGSQSADKYKKFHLYPHGREQPLPHTVGDTGMTTTSYIPPLDLAITMLELFSAFLSDHLGNFKRLGLG